MTDDSKPPKSGPPVPSFDELKAPAARRPPPAGVPSPELGNEEKTATINVDVLRKALQQSQVGAPIEPPPPRAPLALDTAGRLPLAGVPQRQAPPPPGGVKPKSTEAPTDPLNPHAAQRPPAPLPMPPITAPVPPPTRTAAAMPAPPPPQRQAPPPPGARPPAPATPRTDRMDPVTPDMIAPRASPGRAMAPVQTGAPASRRPDPSTQATLLSENHRGDRLPDPTPTAPTLLDERPRGARPSPPKGPPPRTTTAVTQPGRVNPFSPRSEEPASSEKPAVRTAAPTVLDLAVDDADAEPRTKNLRPPPPAAVSLDIEADIVSEVNKLASPGIAGPRDTAEDEPRPAPVPSTLPGAPPRVSAASGSVAAVEVIAHPAPGLRRLAALLLDTVILSAVFAAIAVAVLIVGKAPVVPERVSILDAMSMRFHDSRTLMLAIIGAWVGFSVLYTTLSGVLGGRTVGRLLFGLRLVDARGGAPSFGRALLRAFFALISFALFATGFWWFLLDRKGQSLHDKLCSTFVVRLGPS